VNFYVNIDQINEINKIFLETDVTKLSGTWKEVSGGNGFIYEANVVIKKL